MSPGEPCSHPPSGVMKPAGGAFYHMTERLSKVSILLIILIVLAIFGTLSPKTSFFQRALRKSVPEARCVVYDRPPRTGSTTTSRTLEKCLKSKGYYVVAGIHPSRSAAVPKMVSSESDRMAMVKTHVAISENDLELVKEYCGELLYITGTAPMKKRLYSAMKFAVISNNRNTTIDEDMVARALRRAEKNRLREIYLEAYPFVTDEGKPLDVIPKRIVPDYVIRKDSLNEDLQALLNALRCNTTIKSTNVHKASTEETKVLEIIKLYSGDAKHKWLMELAKDNDRGLRKATEFRE